MARIVTRFPKEHLLTFVQEVFERSGLSETNAIRAATVLCTADEWGITSHGVARLRSYSEMLRNGKINRHAIPRVISSRPSAVLVDGDNGLGLLVGTFANHIAMERAVETGIGWVSVKNSNHYGAAGYYPFQAVSRSLIGLTMTNTPPIVTPFGGRQRMLGTNPIAAAFPAQTGQPVLIDMATSTKTLGDIEMAIRTEKHLPAGCVVDVQGRASTNPNDVLDGGALLPLGGTVHGGGHKGYCLAALVDLLCGVFPGAAWGPFVQPFLNLPTSHSYHGEGLGHLFICISLEVFGEDAEAIKSRVDEWAMALRGTMPASGTEEVLIPGDPEHRSILDSEKHGIAIESPVVSDLRKLSSELQASAIL